MVFETSQNAQNTEQKMLKASNGSKCSPTQNLKWSAWKGFGLQIANLSPNPSPSWAEIALISSNTPTHPHPPGRRQIKAQSLGYPTVS